MKVEEDAKQGSEVRKRCNNGKWLFARPLSGPYPHQEPMRIIRPAKLLNFKRKYNKVKWWRVNSLDKTQRNYFNKFSSGRESFWGIWLDGTPALIVRTRFHVRNSLFFLLCRRVSVLMFSKIIGTTSKFSSFCYYFFSLSFAHGVPRPL